jgi:aspartate aminotransferase
MIVSSLADNIVGSEIIKLASEVNKRISEGERIYNFTIGDFDPALFPIPDELKQYITEEYAGNQTNYPPADGEPQLKKAVRDLLKARGGLDYATEEILIAGGSRPIIYAIYQTLVNPGDTVIFSTPSWNNNHYTYLCSARPQPIETLAANNFMPTAADIRPYIQQAALIALCSPQNPSGTMFSKEGLSALCELVLEENKRRGADKKPLYVMYDQVYWALTAGNSKHYDPVSLFPEMKDFTVYVDGISKSLSATGVRVGWGMGPAFVIGKMKAILTHIGAWAPKPEQIATARYLAQLDSYDAYLKVQRSKIESRLRTFYEAFKELKREGHCVDVIAPQAAIYLTVEFSLKGMKTSSGKTLDTTRDITQYLLHKARLAIVPFYAFGASESSDWYRLSVGTCREEDIPEVMEHLKRALSELRF